MPASASPSSCGGVMEGGMGDGKTNMWWSSDLLHSRTEKKTFRAWMWIDRPHTPPHTPPHLTIRQTLLQGAGRWLFFLLSLIERSRTSIFFCYFFFYSSTPAPLSIHTRTQRRLSIIVDECACTKPGQEVACWSSSWSGIYTFWSSSVGLRQSRVTCLRLLGRVTRESERNPCEVWKSDSGKTELSVCVCGAPLWAERKNERHTYVHRKKRKRELTLLHQEFQRTL